MRPLSLHLGLLRGLQARLALAPARKPQASGRTFSFSFPGYCFQQAAVHHICLGADLAAEPKTCKDSDMTVAPAPVVRVVRNARDRVEKLLNEDHEYRTVRQVSLT